MFLFYFSILWFWNFGKTFCNVDYIDGSENSHHKTGLMVEFMCAQLPLFDIIPKQLRLGTRKIWCGAPCNDGRSKHDKVCKKNRSPKKNKTQRQSHFNFNI